MTFWTSEKLLEQLKGDTLIPNYKESRVKCGAYELSMGPEFFVTANPKGKRQYKKQSLEPNEQVVIPPGQFALLLTEETLEIPADALGFISVKFGKKIRGLINVSGFHVDPGFRGRLKFSVYNAGSQHITLARGEAVFLIWLSSTDRITNFPYNGGREGQHEITTDDVSAVSGEVVSPAQLKKDVDDLKRKLNLVVAVGTLVITILLLPLFRGVYNEIVIKKLFPEKVESKAPDDK